MNTQDPGGSGDGTDPQPHVSDVLLDLNVISTQFILALQKIELSLRQRKAAGEEAVDSEAAEEIKLRVAGHIDDIQALCDSISLNSQEDINVCAPATPSNLEPPLEQHNGSENGIELSSLNLEPPVQHLLNSPPEASLPPDAQVEDDRFKLGSHLWATPQASRGIEMRDYSTPLSIKSKTSDQSESYSCDSPHSPRSEPSRSPSAPCPSESSDESSSDEPSSYALLGKSSSCSEMELDSGNATTSRRDNESMQDSAFWEESSASESNYESESEHEDEDSEFEPIHAQEDSRSPSPQSHVEYQSGKPSNPKQHPERTPTAYNKQDQGKAKPRVRKITTHLTVPRPRDHPWTMRTHVINKRPRQNIQPQDAVDTSDDGPSDEPSGRVKYFRLRNRTPEQHEEWLILVVSARWVPLSEEDKQKYIAKCYEGWKCFYCQLLDLSEGCISQVSRYNCPTTIRRGVPCYFASYDEENGIYSWKKLPPKKMRSSKTFDEAYYVICGKGNPKTEQQFLGWMSRSRERCLNCILTPKSQKRGDGCKIQRLVKPEIQGEEPLRTCIRCTRNQQDCMVSIPMNPRANGKPVIYGLGRVTAGGVEELGPRFHSLLKTLIAPPEDEGASSGESSAAGAAPECSRSDETLRSTQGGSEKKRGHSPTVTAQERSKKSKVRHLPTYSSPLSFVDQLKNGYRSSVRVPTRNSLH